VIAHAYLLGNGVMYLLQQAVDSVYEEAGVYSGKVEKWPTFRDVLVKARGEKESCHRIAKFVVEKKNR